MAQLVGILAVLFCVFAAISATEIIVNVEQGPVAGTVFELAPNSNIARFWGIPFAAPPVGTLRFMPPQPPVVFDGVYNSTYPRAACMQSLPGGFPAITSEDCLNLNIWAPIQNVSLPMNETASKLPVMVFIYGGSFQSGAGFLYDSTQLAATGNVIVVTINYRLGAFGFLASDALQRANSLNSTGNYGLQDQRAAFQWVQRNIAQFGGDASRVTVFGESAGAISTCHHLVSPHSAGLFSAALLESGLCDARTMDVAINNFTTVFLKALNCSDDVSCLQNKTADEIFAAQRKVPSAVVAGILAWGPVVDGYELKMLPKEYLGNGSFSRVPVVAGTNLNEYSYFLCGSSTINITKEQSTDFLITVFGKHQADEIVRLYGFESYSSPVQLLIDVMSDYIFKCPTSNLASAYRNAGVASYVYSMEHVPGWSALKGSCYGVSHTDEIPFVFPSTLPLLAGLYQFTPQEQNLSMNMMISWAHFATTKNPSNSLAPWVGWNDEMQYTVLNLNITAATHFRSKYCEFWNGTYKPAGPLHWGIWIIIGVGSAAVLAAAGYLIWRYVRYRNQYTRLSS